uniref:Low-density lipoprotein receptor domain class A n=1 Tax=Angiostrongylus cantonensis TaxID=6313 RepID=A0A0K0DFL0_ANGCA
LWCNGNEMNTSRKSLCEVEGTVKCARTPNCVLPHWILDGKDDCEDGSDEGGTYKLMCSHRLLANCRTLSFVGLCSINFSGS